MGSGSRLRGRALRGGVSCEGACPARGVDGERGLARRARGHAHFRLSGRTLGSKGFVAASLEALGRACVVSLCEDLRS